VGLHLSVEGGGIRGIIAACALIALEKATGSPAIALDCEPPTFHLHKPYSVTCG
jgi:hypothetical protein